MMGAIEQDINLRRLALLEDVAEDLSGHVIFPVCFELTVLVRNVMRNPNSGRDDMLSVLRIEPLLCARLLRIANAPKFRGTGEIICEIEHAIDRIGLQLTRSAALRFAAEQMMCSKGFAAFAERARLLWQHSVLTQAAASVIARRLSDIDPARAQTAGLLHDLGALYMLYRASRDAELVARPDSLSYLVAKWHGPVGDILIDALAVPKPLADAIRDNDFPRAEVQQPETLADVLYVANLLAGGSEEMRRLDVAMPVQAELANPAFTGLMPEIRSTYADLMQPVSAFLAAPKPALSSIA